MLSAEEGGLSSTVGPAARCWQGAVDQSGVFDEGTLGELGIGVEKVLGATQTGETAELSKVNVEARIISAHVGSRTRFH